MDQEQIEAARAEVAGWIDAAKIMQRERDEARTRLSEVERERDEAREMHRVWVEEPEGLRWYMDRASERAARITELEAEVARLTHKLIDVGEMECGKCDAVGVDCGEHHPSWRWLATQARADIATLRAAIAEAVRRADGMSWPDKFGALEAVEPLRNLTKPDTPSERIMSDKDRENPVEGAHPTQPEPEDALVGDAAIDAMLSAIDSAGRGYSIRLTRLVDEVATYTLTYRDEQHEFDSHEDAHAALAEWSEQERREAVKQFLSARGGRVVFDGREA